MESTSERCLVVSAVDYRENDIMLTILGEHRGLVGCLAPSGRKSRKRFLAGLDKLYLLDAELSSGRVGRLSLQSSRPIQSFPGLRADLERAAAGDVICEFLKLSAREGPEHGALLDPAVAGLSLLEAVTRERLNQTLWGVLAWLMRLQGFFPNPLACRTCGTTRGELGFSITGTELFCPGHGSGTGEVMPEAIHQALSAAARGSLRDLVGLDLENLKNPGVGFLYVELVLRDLLPRGLRSLDFLRSLF